MSSSSYTPNESQIILIQEEMWLVGAFVGNFFMGIETSLFVLAFLAVLRRTIKHSRMRIAVLVYIVLLFAFTMAGHYLAVNRVRLGFITQRNYPGGPAGFLNEEWSVAFTLIPGIIIIVATWMMEGLLVWRCHVVCSTGERLWQLGFAIPFLLLIGMLVIGSLLIRQTIHSVPSATIAFAYGINSLSLNLIATGVIAGRLLVHRHRIVSQLGRAHGQHYVSITSVIIQSAAMYTGFLVVFIAVDITQSPWIILLDQIIVPIQAIASLFILWQIARGEGWTTPSDSEVVSAAVSSLNTRARPVSQPNVIQLETLSTRQDETEEGSVQQMENGGKASFHKVVEV